jgi:hypothetical protein
MVRVTSKEICVEAARIRIFIQLVIHFTCGFCSRACLGLEDRRGWSTSTTDDFPIQSKLDSLSRLKPLMLLTLRPNNGNLAHSQRFHELSASPRAQPVDLAHVHEDALAGLADELHVAQHRSVVAILEFGPYPTLRLSCRCERLWRRLVDGPACDVRYEACTKQDGKDGEVLGSVGDGDVVQAGTKGVLYSSAEVVWEHHQTVGVVKS